MPNPGSIHGTHHLTFCVGPRRRTTTSTVPPRPGLPVFMVTSRFDESVPLAGVEATAAAFEAAGARVELVVTDDREHLIAPVAVDGVRRLLTGAVGT
jgi:predicted esterase